ncbi:MAG: hypothetical protein ACOVK9_07545 [Bacteroidia bacterium]|jgi:hypothetical protein
MKTINISISDNEIIKFGLKSEKLSFSDLVKIIRNEIMNDNLLKSIELAEKYGLSNISLDEINQEVKRVRLDAKNRH